MSTTRVGRPPSCTCGSCPKCKRAAYMRSWWNALSPSERRAKTARRDADRVRESDRRKQNRRRLHGTPEQKQKIEARSKVRDAKRRGDLVPGPCEICGDMNTHAHHDDYSKPLDVRWFCRTHHDHLHA